MSEATPSSDDEAPRKKRKLGAAGKKVEVKTNENGAVVGSKGQELWRPGVKSKLAPGEAVFVPLPKAREEGKVKYRDDWIHWNTMLFLGELKRNNDREWLKSEFFAPVVLGWEAHGRGLGREWSTDEVIVHDADYRQSKKDFDAFVECLTEKIIEKDETIPELPAKDLVRHILYILSYLERNQGAYNLNKDIPNIPRRTIQLRSYALQGNSPSYIIQPLFANTSTDPFLRSLVPNRSQRSIRRLLSPNLPLGLLPRRRPLASRRCPARPPTPRHRSEKSQTETSTPQ